MADADAVQALIEAGVLIEAQRERAQAALAACSGDVEAALAMLVDDIDPLHGGNGQQDAPAGNLSCGVLQALLSCHACTLDPQYLIFAVQRTQTGPNIRIRVLMSCALQ